MVPRERRLTEKLSGGQDLLKLTTTTVNILFSRVENYFAKI